MIDRVAEITRRLELEFEPDHLEVIDEGHLHVGHAGARDGRGHFRVRIRARAFSDLTPIQRHRLIYDCLGDLLKTDVHALAIEASSSS